MTTPGSSVFWELPLCRATLSASCVRFPLTGEREPHTFLAQQNTPNECFVAVAMRGSLASLLPLFMTQEGEAMKPNRIFFLAALSPALILAAVAQNPVPPPLPAAPGALASPSARELVPQQGAFATRSSRVNAVVYGPQGEVQALVLRDGVAVNLPPDLGMRLHAGIAKGVRVQVSGTQQVIAGQTSLMAQSVTANGQTFVATQPLPDRGPGLAGNGPPPPPPGGPGALRGPRGRRDPGGPPPPPDRPVPPPSSGISAPPTPDGAAPPPQPDSAAPAPSSANAPVAPPPPR